MDIKLPLPLPLLVRSYVKHEIIRGVCSIPQCLCSVKYLYMCSHLFFRKSIRIKLKLGRGVI